MYNYHKILFDYSEFLKDTDIKKIEIIDNDVIMTSRQHDIKISCMKGDVRIAPIETLTSDYYERNDTQMLYNLLKNNSTMFDVGANIGWFSIGIAKNKKNVKIFSFEPIPKVFENLKINIKLNKTSNIKIFNFGFYNEKKDLTFYYYPAASGYSSNTAFPGKKGFQKIKCKLIKFDDFVHKNQISKIDLIKCDVEGAELFVYEGALNSIRRFKPIVLSEISRINQKKFSYHPNQIIHFFEELGYMCFVANKKGLRKIRQITEKTQETNVFFLHPKKHSSLISKYSSKKN
ncbi:FkbM family methyltransferase [Nitrosopumilus sp.]|uniref:FkbM family methyltransferase n=1 Tax=Nitrosopumilus sp. TaxID=2024843 RepID=UPI0026169D9F|nr:FkbM family methyltransferase [Nitrosopumilus sp.]